MGSQLHPSPETCHLPRKSPVPPRTLPSCIHLYAATSATTCMNVWCAWSTARHPACQLLQGGIVFGLFTPDAAADFALLHPQPAQPHCAASGWWITSTAPITSGTMPPPQGDHPHFTAPFKVSGLPPARPASSPLGNNSPPFSARLEVPAEAEVPHSFLEFSSNLLFKILQGLF